MIIRIGQPQAFTEQGLKDQQEDRLFPPISRLTPDNRCFVLCDGMGGHEQGEVAAEIVSKTLYESLTSTLPKDNVLTVNWFNKSLKAAYNELDKMNYHTERRPGTTLTCTILGANGILAAHIGDSRIYLVRPGQGIIYRSKDHSLVNQLIDAGELTEEEAVNFPRKNVITRAMQPGLERQYAADVHILTDVKAGDYLFMCCDGILEQLSDDRLVEIISADTDASTKLNDIYTTCFGKTRDNFTCYLIPITEVQGLPLPTPVERPATTTSSTTEAFEVTPERVNVYGTGKRPTTGIQKPTHDQDKKKLSGTLIVILSVVATLLIVGIIYFIFKPEAKEVPKYKPTTENTNSRDKKDKDKDEDHEVDDETVPPFNPGNDEIDHNIAEEIADDLKDRANEDELRENTLIRNFLAFYNKQNEVDKKSIIKFLNNGKPNLLDKVQTQFNQFLNNNNYKMIDVAENKELRQRLLQAINKKTVTKTR
ncbi:MAG: serine/threonine-protein phosphatase [Muribaculaceae bacterium]|nr:serine/threonine-protein phosphatase [Muribaculaceae bacterium]